MRLDRLLAITMALLSSKRVGAAELAERFEVSLRTIYRDIEAINQAGIPVYACLGPEGGYEIMPGYRLDKQVLSIDDFVAIYHALNGVQAVTDPAGLTRLLDRIGSLMPERAPSSSALDFNQAARPADKDKLRRLYLAIRDGKVAEFAYTDHRGAETVRTVEPMGLYLRGNGWNLWGYCRMREALRVFRLSRMSGLAIRPDTFVRRELTIHDVDKDRRQASVPPGITAQLRFRPELKASVLDEFGEERVTAAPDGTLQVSVRYYTVEAALRHIVGFGPAATLLDPPELIEALRRYVAAIADRYEEADGGGCPDDIGR
ncbi:helix-turn-helix transcriptional regulator [Paenibacillus flagellatus]|uniref:YafY family transcriptional regulator n=1 Tax=Paenibacillus flagellatus TaxID=2211139 RepID=A0A2V5L3C3_9BACL|nr:YafY family protein [Paenibacillus flagellatus]PYI57306.1 YafY family transcriptional regulator [Paenibacillus flagellatus]